MDTPAGTPKGSAERPVTVRALAVACVLTSVVSVLGGAGAAYLLLGEGVAGARGATGQPGPVGRRGPAAKAAAVKAESVWQVIEDDPARVAGLVQDEIDPTTSAVAGDVSTVADDVSAVTDDVDAVKGDVSGLADRVNTVASELGTLCSKLSLAKALSDERLNCR